MSKRTWTVDVEEYFGTYRYFLVRRVGGVLEYKRNARGHRVWFASEKSAEGRS